MTKKHKKKKRGFRKKVSSVETYLATSSEKKKILLAKNFMRIFSKETGIDYENLEIRREDKKINMILTYAQPDPNLANLKEITVLLLSGPEIRKNVKININNIIVIIKDIEGNRKAAIQASVQDAIKFNETGDIIEFADNWIIEKYDKDFVIEEDIINQFKDFEEFINNLKLK